MTEEQRIQEVKDYFKNAVDVVCINDKQIYKLDLSQRIFFYHDTVLIEKQNRKGVTLGSPIHVILWDRKRGYADIEKTKITQRELSYEVYPNSVGLDLADKNTLMAVFRLEEHANKFGTMMWGKHFIVKPVPYTNLTKHK